jgi:type I restriction enzyme R subunit
LNEAHNLNDFKQLWIETRKRQLLITHLVNANYSPEVIQDVDKMTDYDLFDFFSHLGYKARALKRIERGEFYIDENRTWFDSIDKNAAIVLQALGHQFALGGTDALETGALWEVPEIKIAGGLNALRLLGSPNAIMKDAKERLFGI